MSYYTALLDANILYPAPIRDMMVQLAVEDLFEQSGRKIFIGNGLRRYLEMNHTVNVLP